MRIDTQVLEQIKDDVAFDYSYISWEEYTKTTSFKYGGVEFDKMFEEVVSRYCESEVQAIPE